MTGYDEFINLFGGISILDVARFILACVFLFFIAKKVRDYLIKKHDADQEKNEQLKQALESISHNPEYRQQSIQVQQKLEDEIQELRAALEENTRIVTDNTREIAEMEENSRRLERNKLQDRLLQSYRYYTNPERNPEQTWTKMEAEAFWELFGEYEDRGGNSYMHSVVQPAMNQLTVLEMDEVIQ